MTTMPTIVIRNYPQKLGLLFWMEEVLRQCERANANFDPDPVHDLRVALRRCRSIADSFIALDPDPAWKQMKKAGRQLFSRLGELRDVQIMQEWTQRLGNHDDLTRAKLMALLAQRETELKMSAAQALRDFDQKQWRRWSRVLPRRSARVQQRSLVFKHLALERWTEAFALHQRALRNRSQVALHSLRIGIKRFRYLVENFLPQEHALWKNDLKEIQDLLGEIHDLDVLWATALRLKVFGSPEERMLWKARISNEREQRVARYRKKMLGPASLWQVWRKELPTGAQIESGAWARLSLWASAAQPNVRHTRQVLRLALQLYDGLSALYPRQWAREEAARKILRAAALLYEIGRPRQNKAYQKISYRLIRRLKPPLGWSRSELDLAATVARYHRGVLPQARQKPFAAVPKELRRQFLFLAGILRLANAFDADQSARMGQLKVRQESGFVVLAVQGYSTRDRLAEGISAARLLLETVIRQPIAVRPLRPVARRKPSRH